VEFASSESAQAALAQEHVIDQKKVEVKQAVKKGDGRTKKIFVGGLPVTASEEDIRNAFVKYGQITEVLIMKDKNTGQPRGFGFVSFDNEDSVDRLIADGAFHDVCGKQSEVKRAEPLKPGGPPLRGGRGGFGGFGGGGYSGGRDYDSYGPVRARGGFSGGRGGYGGAPSYGGGGGGYRGRGGYSGGFGGRDSYDGGYNGGGGGGYRGGFEEGPRGGYDGGYGGRGGGGSGYAAAPIPRQESYGGGGGGYGSGYAAQQPANPGYSGGASGGGYSGGAGGGGYSGGAGGSYGGQVSTEGGYSGYSPAAPASYGGAAAGYSAATATPAYAGGYQSTARYAPY